MKHRPPVPAAVPRSLLVALLAGFLIPRVPAAPIISEVLSANGGSSVDTDGDSSDWIEIFNPDATPADLSGWHLTDNASNPVKWTFPEGIVLEPGGFLRVWASGKNRTSDPQELHTNFSISASGEYLALIAPDGLTASSEFNPLPPMRDDESWGVVFTQTSLIGPAAPAQVLVPADGSAGDSWTQPSYSPGPEWISGQINAGFGMPTPGFFVEERQAAGTISSINVAESVLNGTNATDLLTDVRPWINIVGSGDEGRFGDGQLPLHGPDPSNIALRATGTIVIPNDGDWTFHVNSDEGFRLRIDGVQVMQFTGTRGPSDSLITRNLTAGEHTITLTYFEQTGGDEVELSAAEGAHENFSGFFRLIGDTANGGLPVLVPPGSEASSVATDLTEAMHNVSPSAYVRIPFEVADPAAVESLLFTISYNDGFVAWLNGTIVASRNAPDPVAHDSAATAARTVLESLVPETINLTAYRSSLVAGTNVLAIQGLNAAAADPTFYVAPALSASGRQPENLRYFRSPTPGAANTAPGFLGHVAATRFSPERGYYEQPQQVTITTDTPGALIRYTTNGSTPTLTNGTDYTGPVSVTGTTVLRAAAFLPDHDPSPVETHTYLFLSDVIRQSPTGARPGPDWPNPGSVNGQLINYGMDPDIVDHTDPNIGGPDQVIAALQALPAVCLTTDLPNLFHPTTGIYTHANNHGRTWERPASLEMVGDPLTPEGGFQTGCGVRIRGGYSRSGDNPKHAFRIFFRREYGNGRLNYPLFGAEGANEFNKIDIQCSQNYSWSFEGNTSHNALREIWSRDTQLALGNPATRGRFIHLYINGVYWGLYQFQERAEASYGETYLGGNADDYDVIKHTGNSGGYTTEATDGYFEKMPDGTDAAWRKLWLASRECYFIHRDRNPAAPTQPLPSTPEQKLAAYFRLSGLEADGKTPTGEPTLLDVDNLIDYIIILFFTRNTDSGISAFLSNSQPNNFFCMRNRNGTRGFISFVHDAEHSLNAASAGDRWGPWPSASAGFSGNWNNIRYSNPQFIHQDLSPSDEYRMRFADRLYTLFHNDGLLTPKRNQARLDYRAAQIEPAIIAESARWGDAKSAVPRNANNWRTARNATRNWFNNRSTVFMTQARQRGFYPAIEPPEFNHAGGEVPDGFSVTLSNPNAGGGEIRFTTDGSDPRNVGGSPGGTVYSTPIPVASSTVVKTRVLLNGEWSALSQRVFFTGSDRASSSNLVISEFSYNPASAQNPAEEPYSSSDFEFIELKNITDRPADLYGVSLRSAVDYEFADAPGQVVIPPGGRLVVAGNPEAFAVRYPAVQTVVGPYSGSLNNTGETIRLVAADGSIIQEVAYRSDPPWPQNTDGDGFTVVLKTPNANPLHGDPANWRASSAVHGTPGDVEPPSSGYAEWKAANGNPDDDSDEDGDGLTAFAEYALGGSPDTPDSDVLPEGGWADFDVNLSIDSYLTLTFRRRADVEDVGYIVESTPSPADGPWVAAGAVTAAETPNPDGTITVVYRSGSPVAAGQPVFLRLRLTLLDP